MLIASLDSSFSLNRNQVNAINSSAARTKTFHRGINQGINLGDIKSGIGGIQFKIGFHHQHCLDTVLVYFNGRLDTFDIGVLNRHGVPSLWSREAYHSFRQERVLHVHAIDSPTVSVAPDRVTSLRGLRSWGGSS